MEELVVTWKPSMVALSYGMSFIGSYITVTLAEQYRLSQTNPYKNLVNTLNSKLLLLMMSVCLGVVAVWSMHFIGMEAVVLKRKTGEHININYNIGLTIGSIFSVVGCLYIGLLIASFDRAFTKTKEQILGMIVEDARKTGVKISSKFTVLMLASLRELWLLIIGGFVTASGVCMMHYLGMMSQRFDGYMKWNIDIIALSCVIAVVVSIVAFWIMFRLLALYPYMEWMRVVSGLMMGLAVSSMHYTGIYGAKFFYDPSRNKSEPPGSQIPTEEAFILALLLGFVIAWSFMIVATSDMRTWHHYCSGVIEKTDDIFRKASLAPRTYVEQYIEKYVITRGITYPKPGESQMIGSMGRSPAPSVDTIDNGKGSTISQIVNLKKKFSKTPTGLPRGPPSSSSMMKKSLSNTQKIVVYERKHSQDLVDSDSSV